MYLQGVQIVDICSYLGRIKTQPLWCVWALAGSQLPTNADVGLPAAAARGAGVVVAASTRRAPATERASVGYAIHMPCVYLTGRVGYTPTPLPVGYAAHIQCVYLITPAINEGCTRSLRISHTSRRAPLQPVSNTQVPCTPYHPPNRTGVGGVYV